MRGDIICHRFLPFGLHVAINTSMFGLRRPSGSLLRSKMWTPTPTNPDRVWFKGCKTLLCYFIFRYNNMFLWQKKMCIEGRGSSYDLDHLLVWQWICKTISMEILGPSWLFKKARKTPMGDEDPFGIILPLRRAGPPELVLDNSGQIHSPAMA